MSLIAEFDPWRSTLCTCPHKLTLNPYTGCDHMCVYCYASTYIPKFFNCRPKKELISRLAREAGKLKGEIVSIANSSDPYPNLEAKAGLTRKCLEVLCRENCRIQIITKSNLVVRDVDLLTKARATVSLTITTEEDDVAKLIEPHAPSPSLRLKAVSALVEKGLPTSVRIDPIIPSVNDKQNNLIRLLASTGVKHITCSTLKINSRIWAKLKDVIPKAVDKLEPLYFRHGEKKGSHIYLPREVRLRILKNVSLLAAKHSLAFGVCREGLSQLNTAACDGSWLLSECPVR